MQISKTVVATAIVTIAICFLVGSKLYESPQFLVPLGFSLFAGGATAGGAVVVAWSSDAVDNAFLAFTCGGAFSVMVVVSCFDMLLPALLKPDEIAANLVWSCFIAGNLVAVIMVKWCTFDKEMEYFLGGGTENTPKEDGEVYEQLLESDVEMGVVRARSVSPPTQADPPAGNSETDRQKTLRFGILMSVILGLHNLPEGLAVFASTVDSVQHGLFMGIAIAMHNIFEGLIVATPIYAATKDRTKSILITMLSGLTEPVGAVISLLLFQGVFTEASEESGSPSALSGLLVLVGGVMFGVSLLELLPQGIGYGHPKHLAMGVLVGAATMGIAMSLIEE